MPRYPGNGNPRRSVPTAIRAGLAIVLLGVLIDRILQALAGRERD
jgi:ABC-type proline/glycine betaine transport system permease subunit